MVKKSARNVGDLGLILGLGRSPGEGNGNLVPYSCLENPMDRGTWWATVHGISKRHDWVPNISHFIPFDEMLAHVLGHFVIELFVFEFEISLHSLYTSPLLNLWFSINILWYSESVRALKLKTCTLESRGLNEVFRNSNPYCVLYEGGRRKPEPCFHRGRET